MSTCSLLHLPPPPPAIPFPSFFYFLIRESIKILSGKIRSFFIDLRSLVNCECEILKYLLIKFLSFYNASQPQCFPRSQRDQTLSKYRDFSPPVMPWFGKPKPKPAQGRFLLFLSYIVLLKFVISFAECI